MLKAKFACSFLGGLIFFFCTAGISNAQSNPDLNQLSTSGSNAQSILPNARSLTIDQTRSCSGCLSGVGGGATSWCVGGNYQGCRAKDSCNTVAAQSIASCNSLPQAQLSANCKGCVGVDKTWCVVKLLNGSVVERKCVEKVADLSKGHRDCINGNIYNQCEKSVDSSDEAPADTDLTPFPEIQTCADCKLQSSMDWCKKPLALTRYTVSAVGLAQYCLDKNKASECTNGSGAFVLLCSATTTPADNNFKYSFPPQTCKACVLTDDHSWCSKSSPVRYARCISTKDSLPSSMVALTECPDGTPTRNCGSNPDESVIEPNQRSMTCEFCRGSDGKWCKRKESADKDSVTGRSCFFNSQCPDGLIEVESCPKPEEPDFYTHLPAVPNFQDLPKTCKTCTAAMDGEKYSWCDYVAEHVKTCLPSWSFNFYCPFPARPATDCADKDQNRLFVDNAFYLPQNCDDCVNNGVSKWCITEFNNKAYRFCVPSVPSHPSVSQDWCFGGIPKMNCIGLEAEDKTGLIFPPFAQNCNECISLKGFLWCVYSGFGDKLRICVSNEFAEKFCSSWTGGVAFGHCDIAPEDKELFLGAYIPPVSDETDNSPAFASLSLISVAVVVLIGFSYFF